MGLSDHNISDSRHTESSNPTKGRWVGVVSHKACMHTVLHQWKVACKRSRKLSCPSTSSDSPKSFQTVSLCFSFHQLVHAIWHSYLTDCMYVIIIYLYTIAIFFVLITSNNVVFPHGLWSRDFQSFYLSS